MQTNSKARPPWQATLIAVIAATLAWLLILLLTIQVQTFIEWFGELDKVLDATFFATLAGLALAAASFLSGSVNDAQHRVDGLAELLERKRRDAGEYVEDRQRGDDWFGKQRDPSEAQIEAEKFPAEVKVYLKQRLRYDRAAAVAADLARSRQAIITSFYLFLLGLFEALTMDLWVKAGLELAEGMAFSVQALLATLSANILLFLDVVFSTGLLGVGLYFLAKGAAALGGAKPQFKAETPR